MEFADLFSLHGRRVLITGAAQGIGLTLARGLAAAGAELLLNDLDGAKLDATAAALRAEGCTVTTAAFNVARESEVVSGVARLEREGGPIDVLVNNAGIHRRAPLESMPLENWQAVLDVNLTSAFLVARAVAPGMIACRAGKIINLCSMNCELARPNIANYAAAKGGLKMLTRAMAVEWAKHNIQANGLGPGYLLTEMTRALAADPVFDGWIRGRTPAGRWGEPGDLIGAAVFLASTGSDFMNGQVLYVDGGLLAAL
ncbi:MAG: SDR family oxidoreductase [Verrucomicrobia bacterium]|nr:SDR family oxidoreductase [Verrucomicrobiota bacterium]